MISRPKGTYDLYNLDAKIYDFLLDVFKSTCENSNFNFMKTPTFEASNLFHRGVGEETDVVNKETYNFLDRGGREITLRPEGTAGIVRSLIENKLYANNNDYLKYYYYGSMFRYERPQAGRFREFNQFGIEVFGPKSAFVDAEIINLGYSYFTVLGLKDIIIKINNLGTKEERESYKTELIKFLDKHENDLCDDCKRRSKTNPLRVLDCKICSLKDFFKKVPTIKSFLTEESNKYFTDLLELLDELEIKYEVDDKLVRGLDYYDYAVFEFITNDERLKDSKTICGGGRYNNLVEKLDGPDLNGAGFAIGVERLLSICKNLNIERFIPNSPLVYVAPVNSEQISDAFLIGLNLRELGIKVQVDYRDIKINKKLANADKINAKYAIIIGEEEIKEYSVTFKDLETKEERKIKINNLSDELNLIL